MLAALLLSNESAHADNTCNVNSKHIGTNFDVDQMLFLKT